MESERQVPKERGEELATKLEMLFFETSAKMNVNIDEAFETLSRQILKVAVHAKNDMLIVAVIINRNKKYLFLKELQKFFRER